MLGDLVADLVARVRLPVEAGQVQLVAPITLEPGGAGNALVMASRLGVEAVALGAVGQDLFGQGVLDVLTAEGVDVGGVIRQGQTGLVLTLVGAEGHAFVGHAGQGPEIEFPIAWRGSIAAGQALLVSGYALAEGRLARAVREAVAVARRAGVPVYLDPGPGFARAGPELKQAALAAATVVLLNEGDELPLPADTVVVVKRGPRGCLVDDFELPGLPVPVRDTAGAGDAFDAAFIAGRSWGLSAADAARLANATGAAKVQKLGTGRQMPTRDEVLRVVEAHYPELRARLQALRP